MKVQIFTLHLQVSVVAVNLLLDAIFNVSLVSLENFLHVCYQTCIPLASRWDSVFDMPVWLYLFPGQVYTDLVSKFFILFQFLMLSEFDRYSWWFINGEEYCEPFARLYGILVNCHVISL